MNPRAVLLVEDDEDDVELTIRAFKKHNLGNNIAVVRDGVEALDGEFDVVHSPVPGT